MGSLAAPRPLPLLSLLMGQWILSTTSVVTCQRGLPTASDIRGPGRPRESPLTGGETRLRAAGARSEKVRGTGVGQWGGSTARPLLSSTLQFEAMWEESLSMFRLPIKILFPFFLA